MLLIHGKLRDYLGLNEFSMDAQDEQDKSLKFRIISIGGALLRDKTTPIIVVTIELQDALVLLD